MSNDCASPDHAVNDFILLILSSPSGTGKTTLCARLRCDLPSLGFSVSHTTREPRSNELGGREYHFVDRGVFESMVRQGAFAEWAEVHGNLYGTSMAEIEKARSNPECGGVLFDVDYQGARQIRARFPDAISVFILPPSLQELERRLRSRASEDEPTIVRRLANARGEIDHYGFFDYLVVNDQIESAAEQLRSIVTAERCRRLRKASLAERLLIDAHAMR
jgi:guanylate kinase